MTVKELIDRLECFDENAEVVIGMKQPYGSDFAQKICRGIEEHPIRSFWGADYNAVVITEGEQIGIVEYDD